MNHWIKKFPEEKKFRQFPPGTPVNFTKHGSEAEKLNHEFRMIKT
jgi:hypothetical protein